MMIVPHLILKKNNQILLTRRAATQKIWADHWHCVTGSIEKDESPKQAIIREAEEEVGIKLHEVNLVTTIFLKEKDYFDPLKKFYALELFFVASLAVDQNPTNMEPLKQDKMDWFEINNLPNPMIPGVAFGLKSYFNNLNYAEYCNV